VAEINDEIKALSVEWPGFVKATWKLLRGSGGPRLRVENDPAAASEDDIGRHLEAARAAMRDKQWDAARKELNAAVAVASAIRKIWIRLNPERDFAIPSNRATIAARSGEWHVTRFDTRLTLAMKPNDARSYERLIEVAKEYRVPQIVEICRDLAAQAADLPSAPIGPWRPLARRAIAVLSVTGIALAKAGGLTPAWIKRLEAVGVDDAFASINVPESVHPLASWIRADEMESAG
jgi:hypothetical protein